MTTFWRDSNHEGHYIYENESLMGHIRTQGSEKQYKFPVISEFAVRSLPHSSEDTLEYKKRIEDFIQSLMEEYGASKSNYSNIMYDFYI